MLSPRLDVDLTKIAHNTRKLLELTANRSVDIIAVTKGVFAHPTIINVLIRNGIQRLGDSRLANLQRLRDAGIKAEFFLLRTPLISQSRATVTLADVSLNTELAVIKKLSEFSLALGLRHKVILMIELGDLREGILPIDLYQTVEEVLKLEGIKLIGLGTNLACLSGIRPDEKNMQRLSALAKGVEDTFDLKLQVISGGNSANYDWFISAISLGKVNNLRLGESIFLGRETLERKAIPGLHTDAFTLIAEVIESKVKPSQSLGQVFQDATGNTPKKSNVGMMNRAIVAIGNQDTPFTGLTPQLDAQIIGASSDHLVLDSKEVVLTVGSEVKFSMNYAALIAAMASTSVSKNISATAEAMAYCQQVEAGDLVLKNQMHSMPVNGSDHFPLVSLVKSGFNLMFEPSMKKDYRYLVRQSVAEKIGRISKILEAQDKSLIIRSVWRSFEHQALLMANKMVFLQKEHPELSSEEVQLIASRFIAPMQKSMHATGGAVDALIYDLKTDSVMDFGTNNGFQIDLNEHCYPNHPDISPRAMANRTLLIGLFEAEDFVVDLKEYWHFDFGNAVWAIQKKKEWAHYGVIKSSIQNA